MPTCQQGGEEYTAQELQALFPKELHPFIRVHNFAGNLQMYPKLEASRASIKDAGPGPAYPYLAEVSPAAARRLRDRDSCPGLTVLPASLATAGPDGLGLQVQQTTNREGPLVGLGTGQNAQESYKCCMLTAESRKLRIWQHVELCAPQNTGHCVCVWLKGACGYQQGSMIFQPFSIPKNPEACLHVLGHLPASAPVHHHT